VLENWFSQSLSTLPTSLLTLSTWPKHLS